ncbi:SDR family NAD(P)-dependent oxidoreductase [Conexibacter arvalis]|uniref:NAD(P)-dependent dehydrogenase (Short-subunit alcohol dehydrogenase family) n=1 Tax=Conexibacter arvalis TaxID=912552 RepID=A0A840IDH7_9ACTN|nr:SDR family oxidoreductase [Conexibacter arvalis]MBB4662405.1 NAD(P)-dependent dehydrogenase (short-subunit alcohol dehydrogenase family) [Conexibacter arvalis]
MRRDSPPPDRDGARDRAAGAAALFDLTGCQALVTGGGTGIGRALASALLDAGANVTICGRRADPLEDAVAALGERGEIRAVRCDVTSEADVQRLVAAVGAVDILVNNAGYARPEAWDDVTLEQWRDVMSVNVEGPMRLCQLLMPAMMRRGWGRVVNVASLYATLAGDPARYPGRGIDIASYVASKHAVLGLTRHLAVVGGPAGVTVNALSPGMLPGTQDPPMSPEVVAALAAGAPVGRVGVEDDMRSALLFLASRESGFVTGQNVVVDGGWSVW